MSKADEALADVRGWLCDNLSDGNAGMVCGMLSVVSRNINELEAENDKLRKLVREMYDAYADMTNQYEESKHDLLWELSNNPKADAADLMSECEKEWHRFDAVMLKLGIKENE